MDDRPTGAPPFDSTPAALPGQGPGAPAAPAGERFPWPRAPGEPALQALAETWRRSLFEPSRFFRALAPDSPLGPTLLYYLVVGVLASGIGLFWGSLFGLLAPPPDAATAWLATPVWRVVAFLLSPLMLLVVLLVVAAVDHVALVIFGGARSGFGASLRALAYTAGPQLLVIVPVLGSFAAMVWGLVLVVIGLREVHGTSTGRAVAAVFVPLLLLLLVPFVLLFGFIALLML